MRVDLTSFFMPQEFDELLHSAPEVLETLGGKGSGHFGHAGRPGLEGGSSVTAGFVPRSQISGDRLAALKIPPNWTGVRVNPDPKGGTQVVGRDGKNRLVYIRTEEYKAQKDAEKFARVSEFTRQLPLIKRKIKRDLESEDPATREAAAALTLISKTGFRVGSDNDTKAKVKAYGATTLLASHVTIDGNKIQFSFIGKKGVHIQRTVVDAELVKILAPRVKAGGRLFNTDDDALRDYMHREAPGFTPKDFRTWTATSSALKLINHSAEKPRTAQSYNKMRMEIATEVAKFLGNKPGETLRSYIDPAVWSPWQTTWSKSSGKSKSQMRASAEKTDQQIMTEFIQSIQYLGPVKNWRDSPELGEEDDADEDGPDPSDPSKTNEDQPSGTISEGGREPHAAGSAPSEQALRVPTMEQEALIAQLEVAPRAVEAALGEVLPNLILDVLEAGGQVGLDLLHEHLSGLRTAGGPGSGRYPKGSGQNPQSGDFHVVPQSAIPAYSETGEYPLYHFTSSPGFKSLYAGEGIGSVATYDIHSDIQPLDPEGFTSWTRDPHYAIRGDADIRLTVNNKQTVGPTKPVVAYVATDMQGNNLIPATHEHEERVKGIVPFSQISEIAVTKATHDRWLTLPSLFRGYAESMKAKSATAANDARREAALKGASSYEQQAQFYEQLLADPRLKVGMTVRAELDTARRRYKTFRDLGGPGSGRYPKGSGDGDWESAGFHGTDAADSILKDGFDLSKSGSNSKYPGILGVGVYIDPEGTGARLYGSKVLQVQIKKGLKLFDASNVTDLYSSETDHGDPVKITEVFRAKGFDGIRAKTQLVIFDPKNVQFRGAGGPGSGNFGHAGRPGKIGGSAGRSQFSPMDTTPEMAKQATLAAAQTNPLARPVFVLGMDSFRGDAERYVAAYGEEFKSQKLPKEYPRGKRGECYRNATLLVLEHPELTYVEGFLYPPQDGKGFKMAVLHGWAVDKEGRVVDPTVDKPEKSQYFGVRYKSDPYMKMVVAAGYYGVLGSSSKVARAAVQNGAKGLR